MQLRKAADDDVLGVVGVLILVHQDIFELLLITRQHVGSSRAAGCWSAAAGRRNPSRRCACSAGSRCCRCCRIRESAPAGPRWRRPNWRGRRRGSPGSSWHRRCAKPSRLGLYFSSGRFSSRTMVLMRFLAVRGLVDRERIGEADPFGVLAQDARKDRVEGSHADIAAAVVGDHLRDAFAHLLGGLVGKGERQDVEGSHALLDHIGDARGQHARSCPNPHPR